MASAGAEKAGKSNGGLDVARDMVAFINASWTPFHAVEEAARRLAVAGFERIREQDPWKGALKAGGKYFFTRNYSTIVAFHVGSKFEAGGPFWVIGAHTDSPCLKLKPATKVSKAGFLSVGVQTYGGGLWHTWFDRDLSVAGRLMLKRAGGEGGLEQRLVRIDRPIMRVPTLAIHLDREVNQSGFKPNTQQHLLPVLATAIKAELEKKPEEGKATDKDEEKSKAEAAPAQPPQKHHPVLLKLLAVAAGCEADGIVDFELQVCDVQPGTIGGALDEFVFCGRLDNLCSSYCSLQALIDSTATPGDISGERESGVSMVALFDHEEVGSDSAQGAGSPVLVEAIRRVTAALATEGKPGIEDAVERAIRRSFLVSADMAHCLHPNYQDKHEENHQPKLHSGLVIKHNANQRYATNAVTASLFQEIARMRGIPVQAFVVRNDMGCGSTIGPILASGVGIRTVDVGAPQLSMHSAREMCGTDDVAHAYNHFRAFFEEIGALDKKTLVD